MKLAALALLFAVTASHPAPPRAAPVQAGPMAETVRLHSQALGEDRNVNIYVPPGYAAGGARFPVLYMLDGGLRQGFPDLVRLVDADIAAGTIEPVIVVGIESVDREKELARSRTAAVFRRFVADEAKPWVEAHFRTGARSVIAGHSYGGLFVVETLLREPGLFDDYVASSPSMWVEGYALGRAATKLLAAMPPGAHRLWLSLGNEGRGMGVDDLVATLRRHAPASLDWSFHSFPFDSHQAVSVAATKVYIPALFARQ